MMRWFLLGLLLVLLCGCASRWEHSEKHQSEFYSDDSDCQVMAGGVSRGIEPGQERVSYESCMWERGWRKKKSVWFFDPAVN